VIATPERLDVDGAVFVGCMFKGSGLHLSNHGLSV
jgi:hypothetical protein